MRHVTVLPYNPEWSNMFEAEAAVIQQALGPAVTAVHHIGSTAVPMLPAKPIIDIMPVVRELDAVDEREQAMVAAGYVCHGEYFIPGRRFYTKEVEGERRFHVHVFKEGTKDVERHLAFRDYLRTHERPRRTYGGLKQSLAWEYPFNVSAYASGKHEYVKELEDRALRWYKNQQTKEELS
ncbi:GrpB family protein [Alkalicoccus chagannorensis]|uniref:GrpB family protein n=1 Tax=Alkalicoccus chagannorensis TaxID=427072 RepID=UPI00047B834A|nr:GrpB family protein [Alkalicoccus chagannorensis]